MEKVTKSTNSLRKLMHPFGIVVNTFYDGMKINLTLESDQLSSVLSSLHHRANADGALLAL